jgi:excisionase family DNA binding protein
MPDTLLTVIEVAGLFKVSKMTVYNLVKSGKLPAIKIGNTFRFKRENILTYLEQQTK